MGHRTAPSLETIERLSASAIRYWSDPEARAHHSDLMKRRMARSGVSEKISLGTREAMRDPRVRQRIRDGMTRHQQMRNMSRS